MWAVDDNVYLLLHTPTLYKYSTYTFKSVIFESIEIKSFEKTNALPFQMTPLKILYSWKCEI